MMPSKKISLVGYYSLPLTLRKLYSNRISFVGFDNNHYNLDNEEFEHNDEISEYKENSYDQYIEVLEQKLKERNISLLDSNNNSDNVEFNYKENNGCFVKQKSMRKYKGATVLSPHRGLHYDVFVFDVTSLYPTIIINYNISP